jgi:hypothetical protein
MKGRMILSGLTGITLLISCRPVLPPLREARDQDLVVQFLQLDQQGNGPVSYQARIQPARQLLEQAGKSGREALAYRMDSCFYISRGPQKIYPAMVQSVANGVQNTFEYLIQFNTNQEPADSDILIYQDRYLNQKNYRLTFTKK